MHLMPRPETVQLPQTQRVARYVEIQLSDSGLRNQELMTTGADF